MLPESPPLRQHVLGGECWQAESVWVRVLRFDSRGGQTFKANSLHYCHICRGQVWSGKWNRKVSIGDGVAFVVQACSTWRCVRRL